MKSGKVQIHHAASSSILSFQRRKVSFLMDFLAMFGGMTTVPFQLLDLQGQGTHILVDVEIYSRSFKMVIDTGASKTVFDKTQLGHLLEDQLELEPSETLSTGLGTNSMESFNLAIPSLKIGEWEINKLHTAVLDLSSINYAYEQMHLDPVIGVLGGDIFADYGAVIDYAKRTLKLRTRKLKLK
ncbi:aspartyl protease family protein [Sphingobacterium zeae]|uniref:Aspartyl protease n=2 Tax=Sphingobacterium TaxID=28453 RepID=A0ABU0U2J1_9SPHI|nr:aspartyl protease family protein [Sphingobacterium zeae]MDQ1149180.1 hypothetical protein [Sphingobacterium zeae]